MNQHVRPRIAQQRREHQAGRVFRSRRIRAVGGSQYGEALAVERAEFQPRFPDHRRGRRVIHRSRCQDQAVARGLTGLERTPPEQNTIPRQCLSANTDHGQQQGAGGNGGRVPRDVVAPLEQVVDVVSQRAVIDPDAVTVTRDLHGKRDANIAEGVLHGACRLGGQAVGDDWPSTREDVPIEPRDAHRRLGTETRHELVRARDRFNEPAAHRPVGTVGEQDVLAVNEAATDKELPDDGLHRRWRDCRLDDDEGPPHWRLPAQGGGDIAESAKERLVIGSEPHPICLHADEDDVGVSARRGIMRCRKRATTDRRRNEAIELRFVAAER